MRALRGTGPVPIDFKTHRALAAKIKKDKSQREEVSQSHSALHKTTSGRAQKSKNNPNKYDRALYDRALSVRSLCIYAAVGVCAPEFNTSLARWLCILHAALLCPLIKIYSRSRRAHAHLL
jgi:hypothetical protein